MSIDNDDNDIVDFTKIDSYAELQNVVHRKRVEQPLKTCDVIVINGTIHEDCERFSINLVSGQATETGDNVVLHVNPRFEQRYLVRNHRIGGRWGVEDTTGKRPFTLKRGASFTIHIFVAETEFLISINEEHYCTFPFRIPAKKVTHVEVWGAIMVDDVQIKSMDSYPPSTLTTVPTLGLNSTIKDNMKMPYCCKLDGKFVIGQKIRIEAVVKLLPVAFIINLQSNEHTWPHPQIPLHLNARFVQKGEVYLIRNAWQNGQWGSEERAVTQQFQPGRTFTVAIHSEIDAYTIWVNDSLVANYNYQMNCDLATHLYVEGDVTVKSITHTDTAGDAAFVLKEAETPVDRQYSDDGSVTNVASMIR